MQHIGIEIINEKGEIMKESELNFADIMRIVYQQPSYKEDYPFLATVDPYGYTYFNLQQLPTVVNELRKLEKKCSSKMEKEIIKKSIDFLDINHPEPHTYIKLIGD